MGEEVTSAGAVPTGGEGGDIGRWRRRERATIAAAQAEFRRKRETGTERQGGEGDKIIVGQLGP